MLLADALATARLTRLITTDAITRPARARLIIEAYALAGDLPTASRIDEALDSGLCTAADDEVLSAECPPPVAKLLTCSWCTSIYVGLGVVLARRVAPRLWNPMATALAMSEVAGILATHEPRP